MLSEDGFWIHCDTVGCPEKVKNHRWGMIEAEGWFFGKPPKAEARCPKHVPTWLVEWRKNRDG